MSKKELARSKIMSQSVGGIIDYGEESFVVMSTIFWKQHNPEKKRRSIFLENDQLKRLTRKKLRLINEDVPIKVERFPKWHWCSSCKELTKILPYKDEQDIPEKGPICRKCKTKPLLTPMRFVAICGNGHLSEINYYSYIHRVKPKQCNFKSAKLYYRTTGKHGGDWDQMILGCHTCGAKTTFEDLARRPLNKFHIEQNNNNNTENHCCGNQPWQGEKRENCSEKMSFEQKGSSTIYRPKILSALRIEEDIAVVSSYQKAAEYLLNNINKLNKAPSTQHKIKIIEQNRLDAVIEQEYQDFDEKDIEQVKNIMIELLNRSLNENTIEEETEITKDSKYYDEGQKDILESEFQIFKKNQNINSKYFSVEFNSFKDDDQFSKYFNKIGMVRNLTEIRCFAGFTRKDGKTFIEADMGKGDWFPSIEAKGEGIFININSKYFYEWDKRNKDYLNKYIDDLIEKYSASILSKIFKIKLTPMFILMHTLSHILIREIVYEAGYPSSSLKERIYYDEQEGGILIYTTEIDNAGTLGGLVEQARIARIKNIISNALKRASWCSADPVCSELEFQGWGKLNTSSCHACSLIPETSCSYSNVFLNRSFLIGNKSKSITPFFNIEDIIE